MARFAAGEGAKSVPGRRLAPIAHAFVGFADPDGLCPARNRPPGGPYSPSGDAGGLGQGRAYHQPDAGPGARQGRLPGRRWVRARAGRPGRDGERRYPHPAAGGRTRQLDVGMDVPPGPVKVLAADWLLREAVSNLVDNAIRYSPQGGDLTVRVQVGDGTARLVVEDSGPGMSAEDIARACVRFRRGAAGKQARRRPGPGHRRHHCRDPGREAGPGEPGAAGACARRWCLPWKTPWMLRRITKITEFERCWKGSVLYGCVRGASRAAHGTAGRQGGHRTQTYKFWRRNNADPLEAAPGRRHAGRPDPVAGRRPAAAEPRRPECIAPPSPAAAST